MRKMKCLIATGDENAPPNAMVHVLPKNSRPSLPRNMQHCLRLDKYAAFFEIILGMLAVSGKRCHSEEQHLPRDHSLPGVCKIGRTVPVIDSDCVN